MTSTMSYEPALSASMSRTHLNQEGSSMTDQLPSVNFNFDDLREHMNRFTSRFDEFIEKGRKRVLEERNQFRMNVTELQEDQKQTSRAIEIETLKAQSHSATLQKETAEKSEMQSQIAHLQTHRDNLLASRSHYTSELTQLQQTLQARRLQQSQHAKYLQGQSRHNVPELQFWEDHLCMGISGCGQEDRLKFNFTHVCEKDWEREAWFELDTSSREYRVLKTNPKLENSDVEAEVEKLNENRELGPFFKGMRTLFVKSMK